MKNTTNNTTKLYIGGCSGSSNPNCAKDRLMFGTNTTSFALVDNDVGFVIDNGTGIGNVVNFLKSVALKIVYGLQTHFHLDHISGLPLNQLLFKKGGISKIFTPILNGHKFECVLEKSFETETWPISPRKFGVSTEIVNFTPGEILNEIMVRTMEVSHPGGSVAYKISTTSGDVVTMTDCEIDNGVDANQEYKNKLASFISGASLVYFDLQYRDSEYAGVTKIGEGAPLSRKDWGHSTPSMLRSLLLRSKDLPAGMPKQIVLGHHDPMRSDIDLLTFEIEVKVFLGDLNVVTSFAREGEVYDV